MKIFLLLKKRNRRAWTCFSDETNDNNSENNAKNEDDEKENNDKENNDKENNNIYDDTKKNQKKDHVLLVFKLMLNENIKLN